jgi:hypothetical protein
MTIALSNFGDALLSRPTGREAFLLARSYVFTGIKGDEDIVLDFAGIKVMTPSWLDEFITGIRGAYPNPLFFTHTDNPTVTASLKAVLDE